MNNEKCINSIVKYIEEKSKKEHCDENEIWRQLFFAIGLIIYLENKNYFNGSIKLIKKLEKDFKKFAKKKR